MKTIKIFLASSEELKDERSTMADLILHLNKLFKGRGLEFELEKWEYLDASMTGKRKQDEYNEVLKQCDICMVLFWRKFGSYTGEELDQAYQKMRQKEKPYKIYVFFKNPNGDETTQELKDFIANYEQRYGGHFFCKFQHVDTMKLEFLLQLENYQKDLIGEKAIEVRNEHVYVDNEALVDLNNIPFAANNEGLQKMQAELKELRDKEEKLRQKLEKKENKLAKRKAELEEDPEDEDCQEEYNDAKEEYDEVVSGLQVVLNRKNKLVEKYQREQENLFNTARRMSEMRDKRITERMARAIEAFESGDAHRANIILEEAERDADQALADIRQAKKIGRSSIDELLLKTSTIMSDTTIQIEERIEQTHNIYQKAVLLAKEIDYDQQKYIDLIDKYSLFLYEFAKYDEALAYNEELLEIHEKILGRDHPDTATSYNNIGSVYYRKGDYDRALEYYMKDLEICGKILGKDHPDTAMSYNNIGNVYSDKGDYDRALEYYLKALEIWEKVLGKDHPGTAASYNNIGLVYYRKGDYDRALEYYMKALAIREKVLGKDHPDTAGSYGNIGNVYSDKGDYDRALEYYMKALEITEKVLGREHFDTASSYSSIGNVYYCKGDHDRALEYYMKALGIREKVLGKEHLGTAGSYNNLAWTYHLMGKYEEALPWAKKAVEAFPKDPNCIDTLATVYQGLGRYDEAMEQFELCLKLYKEIESPEGITETEEKIATLKALMHQSDSDPA